ncbi:MAG: hypothetical protein IT336_13600 [Thermomicrobiales bacterium]|nr:hypothetical protein [Thermomicrobiales bacterium]
MADDLRKLLDHIVRTYVVRDELVSIDQDASASDGGAEIESDKKRAVRREFDRADELGDAFSRGIARSQAGLIVLDDRKSDENQMADALIHFLVRTDLATSRAVETEPQHYRYRILINWAKLTEVARDAGIDLDHAVKRGS